MSQVIFDHHAIGYSARLILEGFCRDCLDHSEETSHLLRGESAALDEKTLQKPSRNLAIGGELGSCDSAPMRRLSDPPRFHHSFYYRAYLFLKRFFLHNG